MNESEVETPKVTSNLIGSDISELAIAHSAEPSAKPVSGLILQNGLPSPVVDAWLANVMHRLRNSWLDGPALLWGDIHPIHKCATTDLQKRIALLLRDGFLEFSQFLCGIELLALELEQGVVLNEQSSLGCDKRLAELRSSRLDLAEIAKTYEGTREFHSDLQGGSRCVDRS
ncbi:hypothetical protein [Xylella fastidiosa]|uniref:hypothetical protein n=1 Tax=Xylella fastidiosa TaxID=2371 RepID=UPI001122FAE1|nr:hypothetical protein [Xylella fastidiosa]TNW25543.1 hypothetical protein EIP74_03545 [Xylella fastidiosa subsp. pauca]